MSINLLPFLFFTLFLHSTTFSLELSFNMSDINYELHNRFINCTGDASVSNVGIQVTSIAPAPNSQLSLVGRAIYHKLLHLWDPDSRNLADFSTHFSFVIKSNNGSGLFADGLAFFLAPHESVIQDNVRDNSGLGLGIKNVSATSSSQSFVAVEFDTYSDDWDTLDGPHVGIDINSTNSVNVTQWNNNISIGLQNDAWITYSASSMNLNVNFTNFYDDGTTYFATINYPIDFRDYLPPYVVFGFSAATTGSSERYFEEHTVKSWDFSSALEMEPPAPSPQPEPTPEAETPSPPFVDPINNRTGLINNRTILIIALSVGLPILVLSAYYLWKKYRKDPKDEDFFDHSMDKEFDKGAGPKEFPYHVLARATKKFAESEKLGEGGFGGVYRGSLRETNCEVAVKRVSRDSKQGLKEYQSEVKIISQLKHKNLVQLLGWCHKKRGELLLVYEFMPNGSLDFHLFKGTSVLTWDLRYNIAKGLASALLYLHEEGVCCVVHRDIKTSNILLNSNFDAKLGDFGLARLVDPIRGSQTTIAAGTMGYMAPEYVSTGKASKETDVYSFGVVLLEIACGRRSIEPSFPLKKVTLVEWVWSLYGMGRLLEAADPKFDTNFDDKWELERVLVVGLWCAHPDSSSRPLIRQAINVLTFNSDQLPSLPCAMPVATYNVPKRSLRGQTGTSMSMNMNSGGWSNSSNKTGSSTSSGNALLPR